MPKNTTTISPITELTKSQQQHMLLLFFPLKKGLGKQAADGLHKVLTLKPAKKAAKTATPPADNRATTGVHFFMIYHLPANTQPVPPLLVPSFQTSKDKDLLVVLSIYDADFKPYITAFTNDLNIAKGLDLIVSLMDESNLYPGWQTDPTSAIQIVKDAKPDGTGGVNAKSDEFIQLLMRYNFADPVIPGASVPPANIPAKPKYVFAATFPGLTVGRILRNDEYKALWPFPPRKIKFD